MSYKAEISISIDPPAFIAFDGKLLETTGTLDGRAWVEVGDYNDWQITGIDIRADDCKGGVEWRVLANTDPVYPLIETYLLKKCCAYIEDEIAEKLGSYDHDREDFRVSDYV